MVVTPLMWVLGCDTVVSKIGLWYQLYLILYEIRCHQEDQHQFSQNNQVKNDAPSPLEGLPPMNAKKFYRYLRTLASLVEH